MHFTIRNWISKCIIDSDAETIFNCMLREKDQENSLYPAFRIKLDNRKKSLLS